MLKVFFVLLFILTFFSYEQSGLTENKFSKTIHKRIVKGDNLNKILLSAQFPQKSINSMVAQNKGFKFLSLAPQQVYTINYQEQMRSLSIYLEHSKKLLFWYNTKNNKYGSKIVPDELTVRLKKYQGRIQNSIYASITKNIKNPIIPYKFQDIFLLFYDLKREVLPNAKFSFVLEQKFHQGKFIKFGNIAEAELEINKELIRRVLVKNGKTYSYVGREDETKRPFYSPVDYQHFTSLYKKRRFHPVKKRYLAHQGIDFGLPEGRSIYSVAKGKVVKSGYNRSAGHYLAIQHKDGYTSYYNHLVKRHKDRKVGSWVNAGETIGWNGCSGSCTKPHLHFAVKKNGRFINPIRLVKSYPYKVKDSIAKVVRQLQ